MTAQDELALSYYEDVGAYNSDGQMRLVRDSRSGRFFVKKIRTIYDRQVYNWIFSHPVPGLPRLFLLIEDDNRLIIIEEHIDGTTLANMISQFPGRITEAQSIRWMRQLIAILKCLHTAVPPIIHRDLKPENLVISAGGDLYLIDCNSARQFDGNVERDTRLLGTAGYAAPEQYGFGESDQRTDLYAFGMIFNYLLTGELSRQAIAEGKWHRLISRCVELDPQNRYPDIFSLERAFEVAARVESFERKKLKQKRDPETDNIPRDGLFPNGRGNWRLPGFRGAGKKVRSLALAGYIFFFAYAAIMLISGAMDGPKAFVADGLLQVLAFWLPIIFLGDYLGMQRIFPGARSKKKVIRITMLCVWTFVLFIICPVIIGFIKDS